MTTAWASYRWSGGSLVPIQLFNAAFTLAAWMMLILAVRERRTMALAALAAGGALFTGYIYLFHLHGVFYGPMLLWLAVAVRFCLARKPTPRHYTLVAALALVAAAYHPYTLVLAFALAVAAPFEFRWFTDRRAVALVVLLAAAGAALIWLVWPRHLTTQTAEKLGALLASARTLEVVRPVSIVALVAAAATAWMTRWPEALGRRAPLVAVFVTSLMGLAALGLGAPVVCVWIAASLVKLVVHRRWTLATMLAASIGLPFAGGSGSPTYAVFAIALATVALAVDADGIEFALARVPNRVPWSVAVLVIALAGALRSGVEVPGVSRIVQPVIAERERTHQLAQLLERILSDPATRALPVELGDAALSPVEGATSADRSRRAPTQQLCLDAYLSYVRGEPDPGNTRIVVAFGLPGGGEGHELSEPSRHAGWAVADRLITLPGSLEFPSPR
jgi:hypothetical protein